MNPRSADQQALLDLHDQDRRAHLAGDAELLTAGMAEHVWEAGRGGINRLSRAEMRERFAAYFGSVRYLVWDDLAPPHVYVSADATAGWMAVAIEARLSALDESGQPVERAFESSWIATYEKLDGRWLMTGIASSVVERG
jgi:hypothetical protein